jgi:hypothetical protein
MNKDIFWEIIDRTTAALTQEEQLELFRWELQQLSGPEMEAFTEIFGEVLAATYNWDLWLVAWIARRGMCSDDGFEYLRRWLISRGRTVCEGALADPESVADLIYDSESSSFEAFPDPIMDVRRDKPNRSVPDNRHRHSGQPSGGDWLRPELLDRSGSKMLNLRVVFKELTDEDFTVIQKRFPRLWEFIERKKIFKSPGAESVWTSDFPSPEQIAASLDPSLQVGSMEWINALLEAQRKVYNKKT